MLFVSFFFQTNITTYARLLLGEVQAILLFISFFLIPTLLLSMRVSHLDEHRQYCSSFYFLSYQHYYYLRASLTVAYISILTIYYPLLHFFTLFFTFFVCLWSLISLVSVTLIITHKFSLLSNSFSLLFLSFVTINILHRCKFVTGFYPFFSLSHYAQRFWGYIWQ
jgi:hypothetical protein